MGFGRSHDRSEAHVAPKLFVRGRQDLVRELGMVDEDLLLPHLLDGVVVVTLHRVVVLARKYIYKYKFDKKYLCN